MKKNCKVSINLTQAQYDLLKKLAQMERRTISELAALIVIDTSLVLFLERQQQDNFKVAKFTPSDEFGNIKL